MFTPEQIKNISKDEFSKLSPENKELVLKILSEYKDTGTSQTLKELWEVDYAEIPVSIDEFIENPYYLGKSTRNGESIYPYWREVYRKVFDPSLNFEEVVLTGAIGVGKTRTAVVCLCYLLYRLMCLKNPQEYFRFNEGDKITIFFLNITLDLAEGVGFTTMHEYLLHSPWFLEHGTVVGRVNLRYKPPHNIDITYGSKAEHALGQQIFCLSGDTKILTTDGEYRIEDLVGKKFKTYSKLDNGEVVVSEETTVMQTAETNDYYEIELEDGSVVKCTANHKFMLTDGTYKEAKDLTPNDDLMELEPYGYIYITENLINGMKYIGQHRGKFNPRYKGSGHKIVKAFKEFGKENFKATLLCYVYNNDDLNELEQYYIEKYDAVDSDMFYNIERGGMGWCGKHTDITKQNNSCVLSRRTQQYCDHMRDTKLKTNARKGKMFWVNNGENEYLVSNFEYETMFSGYAIGRLDDVVYMTDGCDTIRVHSANVQEYLKLGYTLGKSDAVKRRIAASHCHEYWIYNGMYFDSSQILAEYLQHNGYPKIVKSTVRNIANGSAVKSYPDLFGKISREKR